jgi:type I restriction enzyme S subunit
VTRLPGFHGEWKPKKLADLLKFERPERYLVRSADYELTGDIPVLTANKSFVLGFTNEQFGIYDNLPSIIFDDFTTDSKYVDFPFKVKSSAIKILRAKSERVCLKFVIERMRLVKFPHDEHTREKQVLNALFPIMARDRVATRAIFEIIKNQPGY